MSSVSSSTTTLSEQRPEADALPRKVGELGYIAPMSPKSPEMQSNSTETVDGQPTMPARHPADRDNATSTSAPTAAAAAAADTPNANNANTTGSGSSTKSRWSLGGVSPITILRVVLLTLFLAGTIVAWVLTVTRFARTDAFNIDTDSSSGSGSGSSNGDDGDKNNNNGGMPVFTSMVIVHVSFTVVVLVELLFLERSVYHARAERYLFNHAMPRGATGASAFIGIAPWNRPPLPTYAAALAESGVGTGDVEDNLIAIAPPPAYGQTRGSVLLLAGHLRNSLSRTLNRNSRDQQTEDTHSVTPREMEEGERGRPISYDASEEMDNARRARQLEETLSSLEHNTGRSGV